MSYKKPTLTEIYTKLFLEKNKMRAEKLFDIVPKLKENGLDKIEILSVPEEFRGEKKEEMLVNVTGIFVPRVRCWNEDKSYLIQLTPDIIIANQVGEYLGWDEYKQFLLRYIKLIEDALEEKRYRSILLETIDNVGAPKKDFALGKYIHCGGNKIPAWFNDVKESADMTLGWGLIEQDNFNRQIHMKVRPKQNSVSISIRSLFHNAFEESKSFDQVLEELHEESNESFESIITDVTRNEIMEGTV